MKRPPLDDLEAFAAVARRRSFRGAAAERGVSVSGLSQRVRALEEALGVRLLNRSTRSVAPTEAGRALLERLAPALDEIRQAVEATAEDAGRPSGVLRINAPEPAVRLYLTPLVLRFLERFPGVRLELVAESGLIDIVERGYDAGVRFGESLAQDVVAVPLGGPTRYRVVAAPELLAAHGRPQAPEDLLGLPCIVTRFPSGRTAPWEFEKDGRTVEIRPEGPLATNDQALQLQAAIQGLGFLAAFEGYVREAVEQGRLVPVLEDWCAEFPGPFLYYPGRRQVPAPLRAFIDFVAADRRGREA
jgi:DNA-binding transcriptional LysR family regulator